MAEELIVSKPKTGKDLGQHQNKNVILKTGRYGNYIEWGDIKKAVSFDKEFDEVELSDIIPQLTASQSAGILRSITNEISIRNGKYGDYIFYKKSEWNKPRFIKLKDFTTEDGNNNYKTCDIEEVKKLLKDKHSITC